MKIAICDDDKLFADQLKGRVVEYGLQQQLSMEVATYHSASDFYSSSLEDYQIVFMDVQVGADDGIEIAKKLRSKNQTAIIIFVSAFIEYAIMGYSVRALAYLLKTDLDGTLQECMEEAIKLFGEKPAALIVPYEGHKINMDVKHILYIESFKRQVIIHSDFPGYPEIKYYAKLSDLEEQLAQDGFLRIHKSHLISKDG